jgi:hypothetical protein
MLVCSLDVWEHPWTHTLRFPSLRRTHLYNKHTQAQSNEHKLGWWWVSSIFSERTWVQNFYAGQCKIKKKISYRIIKTYTPQLPKKMVKNYINICVCVYIYIYVLKVFENFKNLISCTMLINFQISAFNR